MLKLWQSQAPFTYRGKYWSINKPETMYGLLHYFLTPYQKPHPPIGVAAASYNPPTLRIAGEQGFIPMSLAFNTDYINSQWEAVTPEYMADHLWLIGSPETVAGKLRKLYQEVGGFGCLLVLVYDHWQDQQSWEQSTRLLAEEVMPRLADLTGV